uniref:hypothetical protein n=1 Tax=Nostoc sp. CMAA1605 TaxID=2055159 RepID=UPI002E36E242|nr:hypothetical protein [Nostoc sp. CMAA1605]
MRIHLLNPVKPTPMKNLADRQQPIPPPSEPMQYRAIGLVRGRYQASDEHFTQGVLVTPDGVELNSVLLGRIMSLVKNHLDLKKTIVVVYPRTRQENDTLHIQIVGVWEPENLAKNLAEAEHKHHRHPIIVQKNKVKKPQTHLLHLIFPMEVFPSVEKWFTSLLTQKA